MELKKLRKQKGLTQLELANLLGIKQQYYSRYENNIAEPNIELICKLADIFKITTDELLEHETKGNMDTSTFSELKKGCIYVLDKLNESNTAIVFGYMTHILQEQNK